MTPDRRRRRVRGRAADIRFRFPYPVTLTAGVSTTGRRRQRLALPIDITPPTREEVAASAAASPLLATLSALRDRLGPHGRRLCRNRSLRFESSHDVARIFGVPLLPDPDDDSPDADPVCPDLEPRMTMAITVALECGAIDEVGTRLVPTAEWNDEDVIVQASVALSTLIELGPMQTSMPHVDAFIDVRDAVLDGCFVNWLATLLPTGRSQTVAHFVDWAIGECRQQFGRDPSATPGDLDLWVNNGTCYLIDTLAWAGAIDWIAQQLITV